MIVERLVASKSPTPADLAPAAESRPLAAADGLRPAPPTPADRAGRWQAGHALARFQAETERVKVLVDFLARPTCAHGGAEPDPDIVTAYNLAVEAALGGVRRAARSIPG